MSIQVIKYLATDQDRDDIRTLSSSSDQIVLHPRYPSVTVTESLYHRVLSMIEIKKTNKSIFKTIVTALIPDVELWATQNAKFMRENYSEILIASRGLKFF